jgi:hypothetical protein
MTFREMAFPEKDVISRKKQTLNVAMLRDLSEVPDVDANCPWRHVHRSASGFHHSSIALSSFVDVPDVDTRKPTSFVVSPAIVALTGAIRNAAPIQNPKTQTRLKNFLNTSAEDRRIDTTTHALHGLNTKQEKSNQLKQ